MKVDSTRLLRSCQRVGTVARAAVQTENTWIRRSSPQTSDIGKVDA